MPKTKLQSIIFTALMVFCMVYCMTVYTIALKFGGLSYQVFFLAIQCFTVCQIVPVITLFATLVHNGLAADWFCQWIQLAVICFPMALCAQVFFVGPLVRFVFRMMFRKQLANE